jgi:hypothetical protein
MLAAIRLSTRKTCSTLFVRNLEGPAVERSLDELLAAIDRLDAPSKQRIFDTIRDHVTIHRLEDDFGIPAQIILEAISRAGDLTQRGVRGVIAETVFATRVAPNVIDWQIDTPVGDHPYDVRLRRNHHHVRIQVKMQRRARGEPLMRARLEGGGKDHYIVEVQRTRTGQKAGIDTRPYRYGEFDLLAVCMQPSTRGWIDFLYTSVWSLASKRNEAASSPNQPDEHAIIQTMQFVPPFPAEADLHWTSDLNMALERALVSRASGRSSGPDPV